MTVTLVNTADVFDNEGRLLGGAWGVTFASVHLQPVLYVSGLADSGISAFSINSVGQLNPVGSVPDNPSLPLGGTTGLTAVTLGSDTFLYATSFSEDAVSVLATSPVNPTFLSAVQKSSTPNWQLSGAIDAVFVTSFGNRFLVAAGHADNGISVFGVQSSGTLIGISGQDHHWSTVAEAGVTVGGNLAGVASLASAVVSGATYVFAAGEFSNGFTAFSMGPIGGLSSTASMSVSDDATLKLGGARAITTALVGTKTYVFVGGGTDDGISVFLFQPNAATPLTNVFNVGDNATLHLDGVSDLVTANIAGTTYLIAAGHDDDGISIFRVAADGSLVNSANIGKADDSGLALDGANQLATVDISGKTYVAVTANADNGVSLFRVIAHDPGNDFNGDGKSDVLFSSQGAVFASNYEWQLNNRSLLSQGAVDLYDKAFTVQIVGDYDGDGKSDVVFQNPTTGGVWEWRLDGRTILSQGAVDVGDPAFHLLGAGDLNADSKDDLLFRNNAGFVFEWQMDGLHNTAQAVGALDPKWHVQGTGDFNGDGKDDILLHYKNTGNAADPANGAFVVWQMNGNLIANTLGIERPDASWQTLGVGDFNGDGIDDLAIRNVSSTGDKGAVWVYLLAGTVTNHGDGSKTLDILGQGAAGIADPATWKLQQIGDMDGDGKDDILYRNAAGTFYSWDMNGTHIASEGLLQGAAQNAAPSFTVVQPHWDLV